MADTVPVSYTVGADLSPILSQVTQLEGVTEAQARRWVRDVEQAVRANTRAIQAAAKQQTKDIGAESSRQEAMARAHEDALTRIVIDANRDRETAAQRIARESAAKIAQIREMAQGGPLTQGQDAAVLAVQQRAARDLVAAYAPATKATATLTTATTALQRSTARTSSALGALAMQAPDVWSQLAAGTPVTTVLTQQGLQVVQQWGMIPGMLGAAGSAAAVAAVPIAALAAGAAILGNATAEARTKAEGLEGQIRAMQRGLDPVLVRAGADAWKSFGDRVYSTSVQIAILNGDIDDTEAAIVKEVEAMRREAQAALNVARARYVQARVEMELRQAKADSLRAGTAEWEQEQARIRTLRASLVPLKDEANAIKESIDAEAERIQLLIQGRAAQHERTKATRAATDETRKQTEAEKALSDLRKQLRNETESAREEAARVRQQEAEAEIAAAKEVERAKAQADKEAMQRAEERARVEAQLRTDTLSGTSQLLGAISSATSQAGGRWFAVSKAAALAQATVDGYAAVQRTLAAYPWPMGAIPAALVGGVAAVNVAKIAATPPPVAYSGLPYVARDDQPVIAHRGEAVLDRQEAQRYRAGQSSAPQVAVVLDGRTVGASVRRADQRSMQAAESLRRGIGQVSRVGWQRDMMGPVR